MEKLKQTISGLGAAYHAEITAIRRHIHSNPELSCQEVETGKFICSKLDEYGIPYQSGIAGTGVVALVAGRHPDADCIALRADMDALPIFEENDVPYRSQKPGVMHACGHDAHVACLLGAARILQNCRDHFSGTVKLIFQPSEEQYPGGAFTMIGEGVLENPAPRVIIAQHVINTLEAGTVGFKPGFYMASTDEIFINVRGKGGHAATPAQVIDPVLVASHIVIALQQIVSRRADPVMPTVLSIGKIAGEGRTNIIPDEVKMSGTVRTYDEAWRLEVHRKIEKIAKGVAESMDAECQVRIDTGYPGLYNNPALTGTLESLAKEYLGEDYVIELPQRMTAEDFAFFAQRIPGSLFRLGIGNQARGIGSNLHSATFDIDEASLQTGAGLLAWFAVNLLRQED